MKIENILIFVIWLTFQALLINSVITEIGNELFWLLCLSIQIQFLIVMFSIASNADRRKD